MNVNIFFIAHSGSNQCIPDDDVRHGLIVALHDNVNVTGWQIQTSFKNCRRHRPGFANKMLQL